MTEQPPIQPTPVGALRFNTVTAQLEYFDGNVYVNITTDSPEQHTGGTRGLWFGGEGPGSPAPRNTIQFVNVDSTGNAADFGDMSQVRTELSACASRVRAFAIGGFLGSQPTNYSNALDMVTIASTGNATDFADVTQRGQQTSCASATRGLTASGVYAGVVNNIIDYFTMSSTANGVEFGDISHTSRGAAGCSSSTRGIFFLGDNNGSTIVNTIEYVTISTTGNTADFGDTTDIARYLGGCSNAIRGIRAGGNTGSVINTIDFITISTLGDAIDFGDLIQVTSGAHGGAASPTRGVFAGGYSPSKTDVISYVQIMTTGNAIDFGDLVEANQYCHGVANGHGGLG